MAPDILVMAIGAKPLFLSIPGVSQDNVVTGWDVLSGNAETGAKVVVIGGGTVGVEVADFLAHKGKDVTIVEILKRIGSDLGLSIGITMMQRLKEYGIKMLTETMAKEIKGKSVVVMQKEKQMTLEADTVVLAVGAKPNTIPEDISTETIEKMYSIGDCVKPRNIQTAIEDGARIALQI